MLKNYLLFNQWMGLAAVDNRGVGLNCRGGLQNEEKVKKEYRILNECRSSK
jgi:hypothetical protein